MIKKSVLIVEDELIIALQLERLVSLLGYNVINKVRTGEDAVAVAIEKFPDLILMDIRLQGEMDGIEAVEKIHQTNTIPVIYITGNTDPVHRKRIEKTNHLDCLLKPVTLNNLKSSLRITN